MGLINAVFADSFDDIAVIPTFVLTPLIYLGGVFYSISIGLPTGIAALIVTLQPVLTNALAGPILNEKVTWIKWLGVLLGFVGAILVLGFDVGTGGRFSIWTGINVGFFLSHGRTAFEKFLSLSLIHISEPTRPY